MRLEHTKWAFTVYFDELDTDKFSSRWPCSRVTGSGWFGFSITGDLVDCGQDNDGEDWAAFANDCKDFGLRKIERRLRVPREARHA